MESGVEKGIEGLPTERLNAEIGELAAHIAAATCRWLLLVAEFDRRDAHTDRGFAHCSSWLSWRCSLAPRAARDHVRVARALGELPAIREAFGRGELSYSKVRALVRVASPETEEGMLDVAREATAAQLERITGAYNRVLTLAAENESSYERRLSYRWEEDGSLSVSARLGAEDGALFLRGLEAGRDAARASALEDGGSEGPRAVDRRDASNADALVAMAESCIGATKTRSGGDRYQLVVHLEDGRAQPDGAPGLPEATARRLACDASLLAVTEREGRPLSVGRKTRTIPGAIRRALRSRDRCCRFPGCQAHRFTDAHHIRHWADGGETSLSNLVTLCRRHHRLLHEEGYSVRRASDGAFEFRRRDGTLVPACPAAPRSHPGAVSALNARRGLDIGPQTCFPRSAGERMDLHHVIAVLCQDDERAMPPWKRRHLASGSAEPP